MCNTAEVDAPRYRKHFESRISLKDIYNTTRGIHVEFQGVGPRIDGIRGTIHIFKRCAAQTPGRITGSWLNGTLSFPEWREHAGPKGACQLGGTLDGGVDLGLSTEITARFEDAGNPQEASRLCNRCGASDRSEAENPPFNFEVGLSRWYACAWRPEAWIDWIWKEREGAANILYPVLHLGPEHTELSTTYNNTYYPSWFLKFRRLTAGLGR
ncbi:hypothetical protein DFH08DRAFT_803280 [Mycena albidolilacea]|uniref:Uncharacterized protein n=1 Tax=Mycena albidolilacea TaxID=1033008 RepID=A0AAD7EXU0_9AGAR|nr:hypothetical protein DFH08DRAFT_803280 [Mycena albidolilacea]